MHGHCMQGTDFKPIELINKDDQASHLIDSSECRKVWCPECLEHLSVSWNLDGSGWKDMRCLDCAAQDNSALAESLAKQQRGVARELASAKANAGLA